MNEPRTYPEGITCWVDVEAADVVEAARFYGVLFGWTFLEVEPKRHYLVAQLDGQDAAGIGQQPAKNDSPAGSPSWNTYVSVRNIDQAIAGLVAAGGRITEPRSSLAEAAITASCIDPEEIPFRLWQARSRPGAQVANAPGAWNFSDLHTRRPGGVHCLLHSRVRLAVRRHWLRDNDSPTGIRRSPCRDIRSGYPRASVWRQGAARFRRRLRLARYGAGHAGTALARNIHSRRPR